MDISQFLHPETIETLRHGGYFLMFTLMIAEWPFVTMASAFLASFGIFDIFLVAILGWIGDIIGDVLFFAIGRFGLKIFQKKTTIDTLKEKTFISRLDTLIEKNLFLAIVIIKFVPYAPPIGLPYIGRSHISTQRYIIYTILACLPIPIFSALIGFHIGFLQNLWKNASTSEIIFFSIGLIFLLCIGIFGFIFIKKKITATFGDSSILSETKNEKTEKIDA